MPYFPLLYEFWPLYVLQAAITIWMLVDANRRGVEQYWFWIILAFQPLGAWAYFFLYKVREFRGGSNWFAGLFQRRPSVVELRRQVQRTPTMAARLELSKYLVEGGEYAEALEHLEVVLGHEAGHCHALFLLASCHRGLGRPADALPPLQKLLARQQSWGNYEAWKVLVEVRQEAGDPTGALASCRELARAAPGLEHACLLADHLLAAGDKAEAHKTVAQALEDYHYLTGLSRRRNRPWVGRAKQLLKETA
jgi:hypothetical protein